MQEFDKWDKIDFLKKNYTSVTRYSENTFKSSIIFH